MQPQARVRPRRRCHCLAQLSRHAFVSSQILATSHEQNLPPRFNCVRSVCGSTAASAQAPSVPRPLAGGFRLDLVSCSKTHHRDARRTEKRTADIQFRQLSARQRWRKNNSAAGAERMDCVGWYVRNGARGIALLGSAPVGRTIDAKLCQLRIRQRSRKRSRMLGSEKLAASCPRPASKHAP